MDPSEQLDAEFPMPDFGDKIDQVTFGQIIEICAMDLEDSVPSDVQRFEDDDPEQKNDLRWQHIRDYEMFSYSIVNTFFTQAASTFAQMDAALAAKDLKQLSALGHYLKGSSASIGVTKVKDACEKIQHYGAGFDETGTIPEPDDSVSLRKLSATIEEAKRDVDDIQATLLPWVSKRNESRKKVLAESETRIQASEGR